MAYPIEENEKRAQIIDKIQGQKPQETVKQTVNFVKVKAHEAGNFFILWTAVFLYYFFSGLSLAIHGKLPKGWKHLDRKQISLVLTNVGEFTRERKEEKEYGRVVDLDDNPPQIDMLKQ